MHLGHVGGDSKTPRWYTELGAAEQTTIFKWTISILIIFAIWFYVFVTSIIIYLFLTHILNMILGFILVKITMFLKDKDKKFDWNNFNCRANLKNKKNQLKGIK